MAAKLTRVVPPLPYTERGNFCNVTTDAPGERVLYCNGTNVIWRSTEPLAKDGGATETTEDVFCWKGHTKRTTCAAMGPNSQWVASGDVTGAIRVWGAKGDHVLKNEYKLWDGTVKDVCWSGDSQRIAAAGDGKERQAAALIWDTGSKTGEVAGHTKQINSISFRSQRPFRVITGGEDRQVAFHQGPPFKYTKGHTVHSNFVNSVRFSPDGNHAVSAGSDSKLVLYDKDGELIKEFARPGGITGSLWASAWSPDSRRVATAGGDRKVRVWDMEADAQIAEATAGEGTLEDMQIGVAWPTAGRIISVCLDGRLMFWDVAEDGALKLASTVDGTQGSLTCLVYDPVSGALVQGGNEGSVASVLPNQAPKKAKIGKGVNCLLAHGSAYKGDPEVWVFSLDEIGRVLAPDTCKVTSEVKVGEFAVGAAWLDADESKALVATSKCSLVCLTPGKVEWAKAAVMPRRPTAIGSCAAAKKFAVGLDRPEGMVAGGIQNQQYDIQLYTVSDASTGDGFSAGAVVGGHQHEVTAICFNVDGTMMASCDAGNKVFVRDMTAEGFPVVSEWSGHNARVTCLEWLACGRRLVSGALDQQIIIWDLDKPKDYVKMPDTHKGGVTAVAACAGGEGGASFASAGSDGFLRVYACPATA